MAAEQKYGTMSLDAAVAFIDDKEAPLAQLQIELAERVAASQQEMVNFRTWCDRADGLYYANTLTRGGADVWPDDPSATTPGMSHVSYNAFPVYVDVPASLQAYQPIENMLANENTKEAREAAADYERLWTAWKTADDFELKFSKGCTVKALYGRTAAKVYWDRDDVDDGRGKVCVEVVEQPRNLWMGYKNDSYQEVEWAAYVQLLTPNAVIEEFGVDVQARDYNGTIVPFPFTPPDPAARFTGRRPWLNWNSALVEVWDYWYRQPVWKGTGKNRKATFETWNVIFAGNECVRQPTKYPEYKGKMPYLPVFNTFVPGTPNGRAELYDVEPLIREAMERITSGSQMIAAGTSGDFWQLVGADAPPMGVQDAKPVRNRVFSPGPGNRVESITPFIAQFQLEQYLGRIDRFTAIVSGLNDLLLGLAPAQVLTSSKAINALISNYESRISMRRLLLYRWRRQIWEMVASISAQKDKVFADVIKRGGGTLEIKDPSLSPRDEMETATRVANLVNAKLISQRRGMGLVGVDDPETEQDMIREERTDATMFPADVEVMAQLMAALQNLQLQPNQATQQQAQGQLASGQGALRRALGGATPTTGPGQGGPGGAPESQGQTPPLPGQPPEAGGAPAPFAQGPTQGGQQTMQTMVKGGQASGRILTQQQLGRR